ncbi:hypothetical protein MMA231_00932 [Asticcacaulis sp. MM231]
MSNVSKFVCNTLENKGTAKKEVGYYLPLRRMADHVLIIGTCGDCGTERTQSVGCFLKADVSPLATVDTLDKTEKCKRMGCGGDMRFRIDMGE